MAIVPLIRAGADCGGKAERLGVLLREGFAVPDGIVVTDSAHDGWAMELDEALATLGPGPFAVRSSAVGEDGATVSYAGQLRTTVNVPRRAVADAVRQTALSGSEAAPRAYADRAGLTALGAVPAIVQPMIETDTAGVLFTRDPMTGEDQVVIEAAVGNGVVEGSITPEQWVVAGEHTRLTRAAGARFLSSGQVRALATAGHRIEAMFGRPQDVEWGLVGDDVWVLQARPITTHAAASCGDGAPGTLLLSGIPASPGRVAGRPCVVDSMDEFSLFTRGDVLVCRATSPAWTPLLARAAAIVTETGGILAHAAIVAREFGIPAVVGVAAARATLENRRAIVVDGSRGTVSQDSV